MKFATAWKMIRLGKSSRFQKSVFKKFSEHWPLTRVLKNSGNHSQPIKKFGRPKTRANIVISRYYDISYLAISRYVDMFLARVGSLPLARIGRDCVLLIGGFRVDTVDSRRSFQNHKQGKDNVFDSIKQFFFWRSKVRFISRREAEGRSNIREVSTWNRWRLRDGRPRNFPSSLHPFGLPIGFDCSRNLR